MSPVEEVARLLDDDPGDRHYQADLAELLAALDRAAPGDRLRRFTTSCAARIGVPAPGVSAGELAAVAVEVAGRRLADELRLRDDRVEHLGARAELAAMRAALDWLRPPLTVDDGRPDRYPEVLRDTAVPGRVIEQLVDTLTAQVRTSRPSVPWPRDHVRPTLDQQLFAALVTARTPVDVAIAAAQLMLLRESTSRLSRARVREQHRLRLLRLVADGE
jgi:hypothetical protein